MSPTDENKPVATDPTTMAMKIAKQEWRLSAAEKAIESITGDVKEQLTKIDGKLGQLVTTENCKTQSTHVVESTQRYVAETIREAFANKPKKTWWETLREKAAAITVIGGLVIAVGAGIYKLALFANSVEQMVRRSTQTVVDETAAVKHAVNKAPVKVYIPYDPDETTNPPPYRRDALPAHRPPRAKRARPPRRPRTDTP